MLRYFHQKLDSQIKLENDKRFKVEPWHIYFKMQNDQCLKTADLQFSLPDCFLEDQSARHSLSLTLLRRRDHD